MSTCRKYRPARFSIVRLAALAIFAVAAPAHADKPVAPRQAPASAAELVGRMTLDEKLGQLTQQWGGEVQDVNPVVKQAKGEELLKEIREGRLGSILGAYGAEYINKLQKVAVEESRFGIPLIVGNDVIHGFRTIFPIPLGEASCFDPRIAERAARIAAIEAAAAGTHWTFAPMVDICRDARWGRIAEGAGEDPYLGAVMAAARVRGFQGSDLKAADTILACAKHFAAYGGAEGGRDYNVVEVSMQTLREVYLPPFEAAVKAGAGSLMTSFNEINGLPSTANAWLLNDVLRKEWGFDGFVVSDWSSVTEMVAHGTATDNADAAAQAIVAGVDMDMSSFSYRSHLADAVKSGRVSEKVIDQAVLRVLEAKMRLGLFENPYADPAREKDVILCKEHREAARDVARHSMVLLKNDGGVLPIRDKVKTIAVIGPLADSQRDPMGTWAGFGRNEDVVTVLAGIRERAGDAVKIEFAKGCDVKDSDTSGIAAAVALAKSSDLALLIVGESEDLSGEGHSRAYIDLPGVQEQLVKAVQATGVPTVVVLMNGRPMAIPWVAENIPAIVEAWHPGVEAGHAIADVLWGDFNPSGKLPVSFPRATGQCPVYYNHKNTGRPPTEERYTSRYLDIHWTPQFPFGHGLSYTTFAYSNLRLSKSRIAADESLTVQVDVTNTGSRAGDEIVQLYIRDLVGSLTRPVRQLRGFERVSLKPGETRTVQFTLGPADLGFYNRQMQFVVERGAFKVWAGPSSAEGLEADFEVVAK